MWRFRHIELSSYQYDHWQCLFSVDLIAFTNIRTNEQPMPRDMQQV